MIPASGGERKAELDFEVVDSWMEDGRCYDDYRVEKITLGPNVYYRASKANVIWKDAQDEHDDRSWRGETLSEELQRALEALYQARVRELSFSDAREVLNKFDKETVAEAMADWHPSILGQMVLAVDEAFVPGNGAPRVHPDYEAKVDEVQDRIVDRRADHAVQSS